MKKSLLILPLLALSSSVFAADVVVPQNSGTATINVSADVNPTVALLGAGGTSLQPMKLNYLPGTGLKAATQNVQIYTNTTNGVSVYLNGPSSMSSSTGVNVPLSVLLNSTKLTEAAGAKNAEIAFVNGASNVLNLTVAASGDSKNLAAGLYQGTVNLVVKPIDA